MKYIFLVLLFIIFLIHLYFNNKNLIIKDTDNDLHTEDIEELEEIDLSKFNNLVYLDIKHLDKESRIIIRLEKDIVPKTCENFRELCKNKKYVQSIFHRVIKNFMIQGGDYTRFDGSGGRSIFGHNFNDENFILKHDRGTISMANSGPNTNGSQFFITYGPQPHLNNVYSVVGKVIHGFDVLDAMERTPVTGKKCKPITDIVINNVTVHANPFADADPKQFT